jgi:hypothetical protein
MGRAQMMFAGGASAVVLAAIVGGLMLTGSPGALRLLRLDEQKVQDLRNLATAIDNYEDRHKTLPETLEALTAEEQWNVLRLADPETDAAYEYRVLEGATYELCAVFHTATDEAMQQSFLPPLWNHEAGRHCFTLDATGSDIFR